MLRYVVERSFPEGPRIAIENDDADLRRGTIERNWTTERARSQSHS
jgi:hypothetical protein